MKRNLEFFFILFFKETLTNVSFCLFCRFRLRSGIVFLGLIVSFEAKLKFIFLETYTNVLSLAWFSFDSDELVSFERNLLFFLFFYLRNVLLTFRLSSFCRIQIRIRIGVGYLGKLRSETFFLKVFFLKKRLTECFFYCRYQLRFWRWTSWIGKFRSENIFFSFLYTVHVYVETFY